VLYRDFATQEKLDAQYALERVVPDAASYAGFYARESEKARGELVHRSRVPYGPTLAEHVDVFPAPGMEPARGAPVLVYLHGGYWRRFFERGF
jgi:arylformamidase